MAPPMGGIIEHLAISGSHRRFGLIPAGYRPAEFNVCQNVLIGASGADGEQPHM